MKTLYISDLDGTLLNSEAALSDYTAKALRELIQGGLLFSVATARTMASAGKILERVLPLPVPAVLQNGALVYDTRERRYVKKEVIPPDVVREMLACLQRHGLNSFLYSQEAEHTVVYHGDITREYMHTFAKIRKGLYGKRFIYTDDPAAHAGESIIYLSVQDDHDSLAAAHRALLELPEIGCVFYPDSYIQGCWFLECYSHTASKKNAVKYLREACGFDKVVGFGDNLNDLPLFEACDASYAVANAREELKAAAAGVIGSNAEDGVVRFLSEFGKGVSYGTTIAV